MRLLSFNSRRVRSKERLKREDDVERLTEKTKEYENSRNTLMSPEWTF